MQVAIEFADGLGAVVVDEHRLLARGVQEPDLRVEVLARERGKDHRQPVLPRHHGVPGCRIHAVVGQTAEDGLNMRDIGHNNEVCL